MCSLDPQLISQLRAHIKMEHLSTRAVDGNIKIEEFDIKTEVDDGTFGDDDDTQFNAVIFGTDKQNVQNKNDFENGYRINEDSKSEKLRTSDNKSNDAVVNLGSKSTVYKNTNIKVTKLEDLNNKNEPSFYYENSEQDIFFQNHLNFSFEHDIVVKKETDSTGQFSTITDMNNEEDVLKENEATLEPLGFNICERRKSKEFKYRKTYFNRKKIKTNAETRINEEILTDKGMISDNFCEKEDIPSTITENVNRENEMCSEIQDDSMMPLLIAIDKKKTYICSDCDANFDHLGNLKRHIIRVHTPKQNSNKAQAFSCLNCAFKCLKKSTFEKHINEHKEKSFSCNFCDYTTRRRNGLNRHLRTHTAEKLFKCEICDRKCTTKRGLEFHIMIHSGKKPFSCDKCDFKAVNKHDITRHARIHTGEKRFSCETCGYACVRKYHLTSHMRKHLSKLK